MISSWATLGWTELFLAALIEESLACLWGGADLYRYLPRYLVMRKSSICPLYWFDRYLVQFISWLHSNLCIHKMYQSAGESAFMDCGLGVCGDQPNVPKNPSSGFGLNLSSVEFPSFVLGNIYILLNFTLNLEKSVQLWLVPNPLFNAIITLSHVPSGTVPISANRGRTPI